MKLLPQTDTQKDIKEWIRFDGNERKDVEPSIELNLMNFLEEQSRSQHSGKQPNWIWPRQTGFQILKRLKQIKYVQQQRDKLYTPNSHFFTMSRF